MRASSSSGRLLSALASEATASTRPRPTPTSTAAACSSSITCTRAPNPTLLARRRRDVGLGEDAQSRSLFSRRRWYSDDVGSGSAEGISAEGSISAPGSSSGEASTSSRSQSQAGSSSSSSKLSSSSSSSPPPSSTPSSTSGAGAVASMAAAAAAYSASTQMLGSMAKKQQQQQQQQPSKPKVEDKRVMAPPVPPLDGSGSSDPAKKTSESAGKGSAGKDPSAASNTTSPTEPLLTSEDLLKRRSYLAQARTEELRKINAVPIGTVPNLEERMEADAADPSKLNEHLPTPYQSGLDGSSPGDGSGSGNGKAAGSSYSQVVHTIEHPFDTRAFVERLEAAGFIRQPWSELPGEEGSIAQSNASTAKVGARGKGKGKEKERDQQQQPTIASESQKPETAIQKLRNRDPAQAIMEATKGMLVNRSNVMLQRALNKTDLENVSLTSEPLGLALLLTSGPYPPTGSVRLQRRALGAPHRAAGTRAERRCVAALADDAAAARGGQPEPEDAGGHQHAQARHPGRHEHAQERVQGGAEPARAGDPGPPEPLHHLPLRPQDGDRAEHQVGRDAPVAG